MLEWFKKRFGEAKHLAKKVGPGFITGSSDDDPSGIGTYSQTGAQFGLSQLWTTLFAFPFMVAIQEMCGRIGIVTGKGLAGVMKKHYAAPLMYFSIGLLLVANIINIGADLGAMAASAQLVFGIPFYFWLIVITLFSILLEVFVSYHRYVRVLKYLCLSLIAYIVVAMVIEVDWGIVMKAAVTPSFQFSRTYLLNIVALLGTTISPYLFFWQASEEVEEEVEKKVLKSMGKGIPRFNFAMLRDLKFDTFLGMFFSQLITFFIILVAAATLGVAGITQIQTADQAAQALEPLAGPFASLLFALGIIGVGLLAIPILAGSASYALSEALGKREGLYLNFKQAHFFYGVIIVATLVGMLTNFIGIPPFRMLYYTAIINGISAPLLIGVVMLIANNKKIMGDHTNGKHSNILGAIITAVMGGCTIIVLISMF